MKHRVEDLDGALLDFAVALAEGLEANVGTASNAPGRGPVCGVLLPTGWFFPWSPSTDWAQGGPIIDRERISTIAPVLGASKWVAGINAMLSYREATELDHRQEGETALIAAMRAFVASRLGEEVEIP